MASDEHSHLYEIKTDGLGNAHLDISCSLESSKIFDTGLVLLHNFWYSRALHEFERIIQSEPNCGIAYWGASMTYNHPFWDAPTSDDRRAALGLIEKGVEAKFSSVKEKMLLEAARNLYVDGDDKNNRNQNYREYMSRIYHDYPENEMKLFYALSIMGAIKEGSKGFDQQDKAAHLLEEVYRSQPSHPGVLHYLVHVYDDPLHAERGLQAARKYSIEAAAVPHALHMPSHIFTRLGYWTESASTNERAWMASEADVKRAGESSNLRDFHSLNYLQYAYLQLGQFKKARSSLEIIASEFNSLSNKSTANDTPELQSRHVRGRTIYALPDRIVYGYFDMLIRYALEAKDWEMAQNIPLLVASDDFLATKLHLEAIAAALKKQPELAIKSAAQLREIADKNNHHSFVHQIISMMAYEAEAFAALAQNNQEVLIKKMNLAVEIEDSIDSLSQPPYPTIPANELFGNLLLMIDRPQEARKHYEMALIRTPNRPMSLFGIARAYEMAKNRDDAKKAYQKFKQIWYNADLDRPELKRAREYLLAN